MIIMLRKNIKIGLNNMIEKYVKIHDNVIIGNNNRIIPIINGIRFDIS